LQEETRHEGWAWTRNNKAEQVATTGAVLGYAMAANARTELGSKAGGAVLGRAPMGEEEGGGGSLAHREATV
jgi:hypothetical protein